MREIIKKELERKKMSLKKLAEEAEVRYASITDYLNNKKELTTPNLEKILKTLKLEVKPSRGNKLEDFQNLIENFNGRDIVNPEVDTHIEVKEDEVAAFMLGRLVERASKTMASFFPNHVWTYGDTFQKFVKHQYLLDKEVLDIRGSVQMADFVNVSLTHFTEKERKMLSILAIYEYEDQSLNSRKYLEVPFLSGMFSLK